ncbi:MAG: hypothetical protein QNK36_22155 [Colwellia sp.]|nr:hypothetical protein [Colwellia sp.]
MNGRIPTEQIGSIPRTEKLIEAYRKFGLGDINKQTLAKIALKETIATIGFNARYQPNNWYINLHADNIFDADSGTKQMNC